MWTKYWLALTMDKTICSGDEHFLKRTPVKKTLPQKNTGENNTFSKEHRSRQYFLKKKHRSKQHFLKRTPVKTRLGCKKYYSKEHRLKHAWFAKNIAKYWMVLTLNKQCTFPRKEHQRYRFVKPKMQYECSTGN